MSKLYDLFEHSTSMTLEELVEAEEELRKRTLSDGAESVLLARIGRRFDELEEIECRK